MTAAGGKRSAWAAAVSRLIEDAARLQTGAASATVFLYEEDGKTLAGGDPALLPDPALVDFVNRETGTPIVPDGRGRLITALPMKHRNRRVGLLVMDVTGVAEEVARQDLSPLRDLAAQAAASLSDDGRADESGLLANILDSITNAIVTLDKDHRITRLNRNAMAMLEMGPEAVGRTCGEAFPAAVARAVDELLAETREAGFAMEKMVATRLAQGLEIRIAVSVSLLKDGAGNAVGTVVVGRDMTASHELERLRRLDAMKSEFVANVSHELKTPLTSIKAYTEALLDMVADDQAKSFLKVIDEESDRLIYLINDLLNVSHIQSGRLRPNLELTAPGSLLQEVLGVSKVHSAKHNVIPEVSEGLGPMLLDREKMKEVLINLISNAIKYSPQGGEVRVRMSCEETNLRVDIQDSGIGIPKEHHGKLFEAFSRVDSSLTAEIPGTGLGLVICKAIVELHGGRIWFESEPGRGTTFSFMIPVRREVRAGDPGAELGSMA